MIDAEHRLMLTCRFMNFRLLCLLLAALHGATSTHAAGDPAQLTLDSIFTNDQYKEDKMEAFHWSKKGAYYFALEPLGKDKDGKDIPGKDLVRHDVATGLQTIIASAKTLTAPGEKKPLSVDSFEFFKDESQVLLFANTRKVWRKNTRGDYWVLNVATGSLRKLGGNAAPATLMFAKFSPDGSRVAYVQKSNLYVQSLADMKITALTADGSATLIHGASDWVNEEELGLRDGFRWSPDSACLLLWQFNTQDVKRFTLVNHADGR